MKKAFLIAIILFYANTAYGQNIFDDFVQMSLEEKVEWFFDTFRDGRNVRIISFFPDAIVFYHSDAVIPLLKRRLTTANYFTYITEPKDITLTLIATVMAALHRYSGPRYHDYGGPPFELHNETIQWFFNEYMRRIEEYILAKRIIDETVASNHTNIVGITGPGRYHLGGSVEFGYPFFGFRIRYMGAALKNFFEERLGINDLVVDFSFFHE